MIHYRPNVAALIVRADGTLFVGERIDREGAWQFPQGGVDQGERFKNAFYREVKEEVGIKKKHLELLEFRGGYRYEFPGGKLRNGVYGGQEQTYFKAVFHGKESRINLESQHAEFRAYRWIRPESFDLAWLPAFKKDVHRQVLWDFFKVKALDSSEKTGGKKKKKPARSQNTLA